MPKLNSGLKFDLDFLSEFPEGMRTPEYEALWQHVCDSASDLRHLYPILSVIYFGSEEEAKDKRVKLGDEENKTKETDGIPYYSGKSLIIFYLELSERDQVIVEDYVASKEIQEKLYNYLHKNLYYIRHNYPMQGLYKLGYNPLKNNLLISDSIRFYYKPKHLGVSNLGLFPKEHEDYAHYASEQGYLRIKPFVECNDFGIYGSLALGNPPATKNLDAWSASKRAGVWDYWGFLQFSTVPNGAGGKEIVIFFEKNTFFDRPLEIIDRINISDQEDSEDIEKLWDNFVDELNTRYGLAPIEEQKWLSDGIVFDIHSPDEI